MDFLCELGLALGKTLAEVWELSAAEISVWLAYRNKRGFPADRLAGGVACAGAYVGAVWGGKARPADLMPHYRSSSGKGESLADLKAWFEARAAKKGD